MDFKRSSENHLEHLVTLTLTRLVQLWVVEPLAETLNRLVDLGIDNVLEVGLETVLQRVIRVFRCLIALDVLPTRHDNKRYSRAELVGRFATCLLLSLDIQMRHILVGVIRAGQLS